jgi:hypothetical protein
MDRNEVWYVDNNIVSHVDPDVVSNVIAKIQEPFGKMTVTRGKNHTFLGKDFIFHPDETVSIDMKRYIVKAISDSNLTITHQASTLAVKGFFDINIAFVIARCRSFL